MQESDTKLRAITGRLGCQTQRFRRLVACWVSTNLPVVSLFYAFHVYLVVQAQNIHIPRILFFDMRRIQNPNDTNSKK